MPVYWVWAVRRLIPRVLVFNVTTMAKKRYLWRPNIQDEDDNFVIELALAGNATHIITNNIRDFQNAELQFPGLRIVRPEDFLGDN